MYVPNYQRCYVLLPLHADRQRCRPSSAIDNDCVAAFCLSFVSVSRFLCFSPIEGRERERPNTNRINHGFQYSRDHLQHSSSPSMPGFAALNFTTLSVIQGSPLRPKINVEWERGRESNTNHWGLLRHRRGSCTSHPNYLEFKLCCCYIVSSN